MRRDELHYELPPDLVATRPAEPRDASRLLVLHREDGAIEHRRFRDIGEYLRPQDCLVLNNTRVIPARFFCRRATGGRVEALFLRSEPTPGASPAGAAQADAGGEWRVMLRSGARLRVGERLAALTRGGQLTTPLIEFQLLAREERGEWLVRPHPSGAPDDLLRRFGQTPLPPYILRARTDAHEGPAGDDEQRYQTVYSSVPGAVAAPTAGLHFTAAILEKLAAAGISQVEVTLHVGAGTFQPIDAEELADHRMHAEWYEALPAAIETITASRVTGGRNFAVGTTSARVLESLALQIGESHAAAARVGAAPVAQSGWTRIFIYPPYRFRNVDRLLTNFHLPGSTLLALVMAFASPEHIRRAYAAAIAERYRFYSYGDAMLIV